MLRTILIKLVKYLPILINTVEKDEIDIDNYK